MPFTHEFHEQPVERRESWRAEIAGYGVGVDRRDDGHTEVWVSQASPDDRARRLVRCYPKDVADLEHVADVLPELLRAAAAELRAAGLDDLRTSIEVMIDERITKIDADLARLAIERAARRPPADDAGAAPA